MRACHSTFMKKTQLFWLLIVVVSLTQYLAAQAAVPARELQLQLDPTRTKAEILLSGNFHTVEGSFTFKSGEIVYDPTTGKASGEIVFDAASGKTGSDGRDKKMHKDVIESARFPEIAFRPDRGEGTLATSGDSTIQVHGMFSIHGAEHEVTIPVTVHLEGNSWSAKAAFQVPYAKWGMKNPSVLFLKVASVVDIQFQSAGSIR
jgi:polyisoprenoid-binding protein YceI